MLPVPTKAELATFTGRPEMSLGEFAEQALLQATLMFSIVTKLDEYPAEPDKELLATYAIMEVADRILLEQPYAVTRSGPFQTETIGSYSYSKLTPTAKAAQTGLKTGLFWWDTAIDELSQAGTSEHSHGSVKVCEESILYTEDGPLIVNPDIAEANIPPYVRIS